MRDRPNFIPVYYRMAEDIKRQIESGELKDGDMLPTEGQLGETYGVSRMTVRQGLALLAEAGLIESMKGKGTFVQRPRLSKLVINLQNSTSEGGRRFHYKLLGIKLVRDNGEYARRLGLSEQDKVILLRRIVYIDNQPAAIEEKYLPYLRGTPLLETQLEYCDFPEVVAKHQDSVPVRNEMEVYVAVLNAEQAQILETEPAQPAMVIEQTIYSKDDLPLGISHMICHKDRYRLKATSYPDFGRL